MPRRARLKPPLARSPTPTSQRFHEKRSLPAGRDWPPLTVCASPDADTFGCSPRSGRFRPRRRLIGRCRAIGNGRRNVRPERCRRLCAERPGRPRGPGRANARRRGRKAFAGPLAGDGRLAREGRGGPRGGSLAVRQRRAGPATDLRVAALRRRGGLSAPRGRRQAADRRGGGQRFARRVIRRRAALARPANLQAAGARPRNFEHRLRPQVSASADTSLAIARRRIRTTPGRCRCGSNTSATWRSSAPTRSSCCRPGPTMRPTARTSRCRRCR